MRFTVRQIMTTRLVTIDADASIDDVFEMLLRYNVSGLPVVDAEHRLVAVISEADLLRLLDSPPVHGERLSEYWTKKVISVHPDDMLPDVVELFLSHPVRRFPVVDETGRLVGVVSRRDVIRKIRDVRARVVREREARGEHGLHDAADHETVSPSGNRPVASPV